MTPEQAEIARQCAAIAAQFDSSLQGHVVIAITIAANIAMLIRLWLTSRITTANVATINRKLNGS